MCIVSVLQEYNSKFYVRNNPFYFVFIKVNSPIIKCKDKIIIQEISYEFIGVLITKQVMIILTEITCVKIKIQ